MVESGADQLGFGRGNLVVGSGWRSRSGGQVSPGCVPDSYWACSNQRWRLGALRRLTAGGVRHSPCAAGFGKSKSSSRGGPRSSGQKFPRNATRPGWRVACHHAPARRRELRATHLNNWMGNAGFAGDTRVSEGFVGRRGLRCSLCVSSIELRKAASLSALPVGAARLRRDRLQTACQYCCPPDLR